MSPIKIIFVLMQHNSKLLYRIALTLIKGVGVITARQLLEYIEDEEQIFKSSKKELSKIRGIDSKIVSEIQNPEILTRAEQEIKFIEKNNIDTFFIKDDDYPLRLKECLDAPIILYYKGKADLNAKRIISVVGTRQSTNYGNSFCDEFIKEAAGYFPDTLIISGLAYGIDIQSHKAALHNSLSTVGVLAHGLDRIYPSIHRKTAIEMLEKGGLLTEFISGTEPERYNFVRRNRIVAGMADALIVVESNIKGGALITAEIANSYNREVFAVPGRTTDKTSLGCNKLIYENKAQILRSFDDFVECMNWKAPSKPKQPIQQQLFIELTNEEKIIYDLLSSVESMHVNLISSTSNINILSLFPTLLEMEMRNIIRALPGGLYQLK